MTPCERVKSIFDSLSADPTLESADKLAAQIGGAELANISEHIEECPVCEKEFSDKFSPDSPVDEKEGHLILAFLRLFAGADEESEGERLAREEMLKRLDESERQIEEVVCKFVKDRSAQLAPEYYGISTERYRYAVFILAADALSMLLVRSALHALNDRNACFALTDDGRILHNGNECIPQVTVIGEIARMIRPAQDESDELDMETATKLVHWLFQALAYGNKLIITDYSGTPEILGAYPNSVCVITLTPTGKSRSESDQLDGWK